MATNSQVAFNPQGETVVIAAAAVAPDGVQVPVNQHFSAQETGQVRGGKVRNCARWLLFASLRDARMSNDWS